MARLVWALLAAGLAAAGADHWADGLRLFHDGDVAGAAAAWRAAQAADPANADVAANLGTAQLILDRPKRALRNLRLAVRADPRNSVAQRNLAAALDRLGRAEAALPHLQAATAADPLNAQGWLLLGQMASGVGRAAVARDAFREAWALDPADWAAAHNYGVAAGSVEAMLAVVEAFPAQAESWNQLGTYYGQQGDADAAVGAFRAALDLDPANAAAASNLAICVTDQCFRVKLLRDAVALNPRLPTALYNLGVTEARYSCPGAAQPPLALLRDAQRHFAAGARGLRAPQLDLGRGPPGLREFEEGEVVLQTVLEPTVLRDVVVEGDDAAVHDGTARDGVAAASTIFLTSSGAWQPLHTSLDPAVSGASADKALRLPRAGLVAHMSAGGNYFCWLTQAVPRLLRLLPSSSLPLIVPRFSGDPARRYVDETLRLLGVDPARVVEHRGDVRLVVGELSVVSWASSGPYHELRAPQAALEAVRGALADFGEPELLVWVSRNGDRLGSGNRRVANEPEVLDALGALAAREGLRLVTFHGETSGVAAAARVFGRAARVAGVHGAGLANIVFCRPGTRVAEVALQEEIYGAYGEMAARLGLRYAAVGMLPRNSFEAREVVVSGVSDWAW